MKKIEAIIRKTKFDVVRKSLHEADIDFLSWWEVRGQGTAKQGLIFRGIANITAPHNVPMVVMGAGLLWFGWFGFNAGSGLAADGLAANAFLVTHIAAASAALSWALLDWILNKKPTVVGILNVRLKLSQKSHDH